MAFETGSDGSNANASLIPLGSFICEKWMGILEEFGIMLGLFRSTKIKSLVDGELALMVA